MFRSKPKNYDGISQLIDETRYIGGVGAKEISQLLESVNDFLTDTRPEGQPKRDQKITEARIIQILTSAADAITSFSSLNINTNKSHEALDLAKNTITDRLNLLRITNDKVCLYYDNNDNPLKKILNTSIRLEI